VSQLQIATFIEPIAGLICYIFYMAVECPTCGGGATWADSPNKLYYCSRDEHKYCHFCGNWNIWITKCRCPICEKEGKVIAKMISRDDED
jgi:hypothetical protein